MKLNLLFVFILSLSVFGCKKDNIAAINGTWELKFSVEGISGKRTDYAQGNGTLLKFSAPNYQIYTNNQLSKSGTFKLIQEKSYIANTTGNRIIYDSQIDDLRNFCVLEARQLTIYVDATDAPSATYRRID